MTVDFSRLRRSWLEWTGLVGFARVAVSTDCEDCRIAFTSEDQSYHLRQTDDWWTVDEVNDRGRRYNSTVKLSAFDLAEKYLIWDWASLVRASIGVPSLGIRLNARGYAPGIEVIETEREYFVELRAPTGRAIFPMSSATIFSHLMSTSVDEVERQVKNGTPLGSSGNDVHAR